MAQTYPKILLRGTYAQYLALGSKNPDALYFCTDNGKLFLGTIDYTNDFVAQATDPTGANAVPGKIYYNTATGDFLTLIGNEIKTLSFHRVTSISSSLAQEDGSIPSTYAVKQYVDSQTGGGAVVKSVQQKVDSSTGDAVEGTIQYVTGDDTAHDVEMTGVVTTPTYEASTRTFTFPVTGKNDVVIELGKDIFIDPQGNNRYENGFIYLYLNDGTQSADPTELAIPVTGLIIDYVGGDTYSVTLTVDQNTHVVTADAVLKPDITTAGSEWENALKLSTASGAEGLYVDLDPVYEEIAALAAATTVWGSFS